MGYSINSTLTDKRSKKNLSSSDREVSGKIDSSKREYINYNLKESYILKGSKADATTNNLGVSVTNNILHHLTLIDPSRLNSVIARAKDGSKFKLEWYHKNYLDHVYAVSDDSGDILEHYRYTAFGEVTIYNENGQLQNTTQIDNHILWNTRRRDEVTGYYMYKFRHYSAELGRWLARDPIEEDGSRYNLYEFSVSNPLNLWDVLGLAPSTEELILDTIETRGLILEIRRCLEKKCPSECRHLYDKYLKRYNELQKNAAEYDADNSFFYPWQRAAFDDARNGFPSEIEEFNYAEEQLIEAKNTYLYTNELIDSSTYVSSTDLDYVDQSYMATADGFIPYYNPYEGQWDSSDPLLQWSNQGGRFSRDLLLLAFNIKVSYAIGSKFMDPKIYGPIGMTAGGFILRSQVLSPANLLGGSGFWGGVGRTVGLGVEGYLGYEAIKDDPLGNAHDFLDGPYDNMTPFFWYGF